MLPENYWHQQLQHVWCKFISLEKNNIIIFRYFASIVIKQFITATNVHSKNLYWCFFARVTGNEMKLCTWQYINLIIILLL